MGGAASPPGAHVTAAFAPLLASASADEWSGELLPASLKALKRTPDSAIVGLGALLNALPPRMTLDGAAIHLVTGIEPLLLGTALVWTGFLTVTAAGRIERSLGCARGRVVGFSDETAKHARGQAGSGPAEMRRARQEAARR